MSEQIKLRLLYAPVKRIERSRSYQRSCYEVGLLQQQQGSKHTFLAQTINTNDPIKDTHQLMSSSLQTDHHVSALSIHSLDSHISNNTEGTPHCVVINLFHAIPAIDTDQSRESESEPNDGQVKFFKMSTLIQSPGAILHSNWELLLILDQWLHDQHTLPHTNPDLLFTPDTTGHSLVGTIQDIVENPLHRQPPEDSLVVAINNPVFTPIETTN